MYSVLLIFPVLPNRKLVPTFPRAEQQVLNLLLLMGMLNQKTGKQITHQKKQTKKKNYVIKHIH